jgi:predicted acylesterase/phospholipase RssA
MPSGVAYASILTPAKVLAGCSAGAVVASGLAWALLKDKKKQNRFLEDEPKKSTRLLKKAVYLTTGVAALLGSALSWSLSGEATFVKSILEHSAMASTLDWLHYFNVVNSTPEHREELIQEIGKYRLALRILSILCAGSGIFCLKKALLDGEGLHEVVDSLHI